MDAGSKTTEQLDTAIRDLTARACQGKATPEELAAGTFTLNICGGLRGEIAPRQITQLSLVFDHRICDGGTGADFLRVFADAIENPATAIRSV